MRILSLNAWGGAMYDDLADWLPTTDAEVVCLQEVTRTRGLSGWTSFGDDARQLPQRADLHDDVRALLPDHDPYFAASDVGPVVDDHGATHHQEFGIATYVGPRAARLEWTTSFVHGDHASYDDRWPADRPRVAAAMRVDVPHQPTTTIVQLHGLRDPAGKHDTLAREAQAHRLADLAQRVAHDGDLAIVCGDFNVLPDSVTFEILQERMGLTDLVGDTDTRTSRYDKKPRSASYMLVSDPTLVRDFDVVTTPEVSDHRALRLET